MNVRCAATKPSRRRPPAAAWILARLSLNRDGCRTQREQIHAGVELDARGDRRIGREQRERLVERVVERHVVAGPYGIESGTLDGAHGVPLRGGRMGLELRAEPEDDLLTVH